MKVIILIGSLELGGAQSMALRLLDGLEWQGLDVHLMTLDGNREVPVHGDSDRATELSKRIHALSQADVRRNTLHKVLTVPVQWMRLCATLRRLQCEVLISFMERANIFSLLTPGRHKRIISIRKHLSMALAAKTKPKRLLIRLVYPWLLGRADGINFNSQEAANDFQNVFPVSGENISVISNSCDRELIHEMAKEPLPEEWAAVYDKPVVLACGRLVKAKGFEHLLRAFQPVSIKYPDLRLVIVGDGPLKQELQRLTRNLKIEHSVSLPGHQVNPFAWMGRASFFVLSSLAEGFPNVLLEAMTLGLPVISTACPSGPREILDDSKSLDRNISEIYLTKYGMLIPRLDLRKKIGYESSRAGTEALTQAMVTLHENDELRNRYAQAAQERAATFSVERFYEQWLELLQTE